MAKKKTPSKKPAKKGKKPPAKKSEASTPTQKKERYQALLRVELTKDEVAEAARDAADKLALRDNKHEQLKAHNEHAKAEIKDLEAELRRLSGMVREKATKRNVIVERTYDHIKKSVEDVRTDTGETIHARPMTDTELQMDMPFRDIEDEFSDSLDDDEGLGDPDPKEEPKSKPRQKKPKEEKPADKPADSEFKDPAVDGDDKEDPEAAE